MLTRIKQHKVLETDPSIKARNFFKLLAYTFHRTSFSGPSPNTHRAFRTDSLAIKVVVEGPYGGLESDDPGANHVEVVARDEMGRV